MEYRVNYPVGPSPLVSVLIPSYNHSRYIEECLNSVYDEEWPAIELLVVDDASSDNSFDVASEWASRHRDRFERIEIVRHSTNRGVGATLNDLVSMAHGEYLVPLASDDLLIRGGIRKRVEALRGSPSPSGAVIGDSWLIDEQGERREKSALHALHRANKTALRHARTRQRELILNWSIPGPVLLFHRGLLPVLGGQMYLEGASAEDRDLYLRIMAVDALTFIDEPVSWYRIHSLNASAVHATRISHELLAAERAHAPSFPPQMRLLLRLMAAIGERRLLRDSATSPHRSGTLLALRALRKLVLSLNAISAAGKSTSDRFRR